MQNTEMFFFFFSIEKIEIFIEKVFIIDCGYTLEPHSHGGSNEYPQSMFWIKTKKNVYTPEYPSFTEQKWSS